MSGVGITEKTAGRIEHSVEHRDEFSDIVLRDHSIQLSANIGGPFGSVGERAHCRLRIRHQQRGRKAFAGDVRNAKRHDVIIQPYGIKVVATA